MIDWLFFMLMAWSVYIFAAQAGVFSEKSGIINIGIEGMMVFGALMYASILQTFDPTPAGNWSNSGYQYLTFFICFITGSLVSLLLSIPTILFSANQVITGTALNIFAFGVTLLIFDSNPGWGGNLSVKEYEDILVGGKSGHILIFLAIAIIFTLISWCIINKTKFGLRLKASGENPNALAAAGVNVNKIRFIAIAISGMFATMAGAMAARFFGSFNGSVRGMGFIAIGILIMGQWTIEGVFISSLLFSAVSAITRVESIIQTIPREAAFAIQFTLPIITLMIFQSKGAPKAIGKPYNKEKR